METDGMDLDIIINPKTNEDGQAVIQLETAAGAAIKHFKATVGINVPRSRFLPVKSCSDLLLIKSNIYSLSHGQPQLNDCLQLHPSLSWAITSRRYASFIPFQLIAGVQKLIAFSHVDRSIPKTIQVYSHYP